MRFNNWLAGSVVWSAAIALAACGSSKDGDDGGDGGDQMPSGGEDMTPSSGSPGAGSGGGPSSNGGSSGRAGSGMGGGAPGGGGLGAVAGSGGACTASLMYPAPDPGTLKSCSKGFTACVNNATTAEEEQACHDAELQECLSCQGASVFNCSTRNGCADEFGGGDCCIDQACVQRTEACVTMAAQTTCSAATNGFLECVSSSIEQDTCPLVDPQCVREPDPEECIGTATTELTNLAFRNSYTSEDDGAIDVFILPSTFDGIRIGDVGMIVNLYPVDGQTSYLGADGRVRCLFVGFDQNGWQAISNVACDLEVDTLEYASAAEACDGKFAGRLLEAGTTQVTFDATLTVAESQITEPPCRGAAAGCTENAQCCSMTCTMSGTTGACSN